MHKAYAMNMHSESVNRYVVLYIIYSIIKKINRHFHFQSDFINFSLIYKSMILSYSKIPMNYKDK